MTVVAIGDSTSVSASPAASISSSSSASGSGAKGAVYRLGADGLVDTYWEATGELPFDLLPTPSGRLLVSADNGVVYALDGEPVRTARIAQVPGRQLTRIVPRGDRFLVTASNPGKILELAGASAPTGSYTSEVKDATTGASWGLLRWEGHAAGRQHRSPSRHAAATHRRQTRPGPTGCRSAMKRGSSASPVRRRGTCNGRSIWPARPCSTT